MSEPDNLVSVYYFRTAAANSEAQEMSTFKATRDAIDTHFGGVLLPGTEERVPIDALDEMGRYVNAPSAWTDLQ